MDQAGKPANFSRKVDHMKLRTRILALAAIAALGAGVGQAQAAATIINSAGTVALGVNDLGHLNTTVGNVANNSGRTGLSYNFGTAAAPDFRDATSPGCFCEGWGVSVEGTVSGYANVAGGTAGLSLVSFANSATTATSAVALSTLGFEGLKITHAYAEAAAAPGALFEAKVTITNDTGAKVNDVKYVRAMDWDVPPTEFAEYVTIKGTASTTLLELSHNNGFATSDPLSEPAEIFAGSCGSTTNVDFTDCGAADHGAYFRFNFGSLEDGESYTFSIFYGAAESERAAISAISAADIELYSLGQSGVTGTSSGPTLGTPATFIFGFKGVGGVVIEPVSAPGTLALAGLALLGLGAARRRQA
jgi:hypothetical protein